MQKVLMIFAVLTVFTVFCGACSTRHAIEVAPVEVKPIHITIDVNVKIDRALDDFFSDIDKAESKLQGSGKK
ncbi:MAG: hypothetical protein GX654_12065 [Desulfatiglans sp.]|jgi:hypothetical protein|nr:hypothetical protein [Desulfatiglans sp.]